METIDFTNIGRELLPDIPKKDLPPIWRGQKVYRSMSDNLTKIYFDVIVTEGYNPNVHWSLLGYKSTPDKFDVYGARGIKAEVRVLGRVPAKPIFDPSESEVDMPCHAKLSGSFIIDAIVSGQKISFEHPEDMKVLENWIDQYLKSYENVDLTRYPDRKAFNESAKKALNIMRGNIRQMNDWQEERNPSPLSLAEIISNL